LPVKPLRDQEIAAAPAVDVSEDEYLSGAELFMEYCSVCHGAYAISSGVIPDLRRMHPLVRSQFSEIVLQGLREPLGMPNFSDLLSSDDVQLIEKYILRRTNLSATSDTKVSAH